MKVKFLIATLILVAFCFTAGAQKNKMPDSDAPAAKSGKPNIVVIMADDIGWSNIGIYNQGMMAVRTPNLDRMLIHGSV